MSADVPRSQVRNEHVKCFVSLQTVVIVELAGLPNPEAFKHIRGPCSVLVGHAIYI